MLLLLELCCISCHVLGLLVGGTLWVCVLLSDAIVLLGVFWNGVDGWVLQSKLALLFTFVEPPCDWVPHVWVLLGNSLLSLLIFWPIPLLSICLFTAVFSFWCTFHSLVFWKGISNLEIKAELVFTLYQNLKLMHPFIPFITELIYRKLKELNVLETQENVLMYCKYPTIV